MMLVNVDPASSRMVGETEKERILLLRLTLPWYSNINKLRPRLVRVTL